MDDGSLGSYPFRRQVDKRMEELQWRSLVRENGGLEHVLFGEDCWLSSIGYEILAGIDAGAVRS